MSSRCNAFGEDGSCPSGPKSRHKCEHLHARRTGVRHAEHRCKHCGATYT